MDESGVSTQMTRLYARAERGERVHDAVPGGHWKMLTILGAMDHNGMLAAMTVEAATDRDVFLAYLDEVLCPKLRSGHVVVMDNLSAHKVDGVVPMQPCNLGCALLIGVGFAIILVEREITIGAGIDSQPFYLLCMAGTFDGLSKRQDGASGPLFMFGPLQRRLLGGSFLIWFGALVRSLFYFARVVAHGSALS